MSVHLELDGAGSLQQRLARALEAAIRSGRLPAGSRLPSSRSLAHDLGIARNTAALALDDIVSRGLARAEARRGLFVNEVATSDATSAIDAADTTPVRVSRRARASIDAVGDARPMPALRHELDYGQPLASPTLLHAWRQAVARAVERLPADYPPPRGLPALREAVAAMLVARRGLDADPDGIVIVAGAQQAFDLIAQVLIDPGDRIGLEDPHYEGARQAYLAAGAELHACGVDDDGMRVDDLPHDGVRLVHVTPSHQFPTGALLSSPRRRTLIDYARRHDAVIVEDDYDAELRFGAAPAPALHALAGGDLVIYVGTFSKMLFPALRLGYLVLPPPLRRAFAAAKHVADRGSGMLEQAAVADMLASGAIDRHLRRLARELERRRSALMDVLARQGDGRIDVSGINAGMHVVARIRGLPWTRFGELEQRARTDGLRLVPVKPHRLPTDGDVAVLLGFSAAPPAAIADAARCLCRAVAALALPKPRR